MPLLRYEVEDFAVWADGKCPCGSPLPAFQAIRGRYSDSFVRRDGAVVRGLTRLLEAQSIEEIQVVQTDYDEIRILYVPRSPMAAAEVEHLAKSLRGIMGSNCRVLVEQVASIPPSPGGKHLYIISEVWRRLESSED
jgi:phenylacetate-CoA ligase